ncbi:hypothetical protein ACRAWD_20485 [Caulobacter segnis]
MAFPGVELEVRLPAADGRLTARAATDQIGELVAREPHRHHGLSRRPARRLHARQAGCAPATWRGWTPRVSSPSPAAPGRHHPRRTQHRSRARSKKRPTATPPSNSRRRSAGPTPTPARSDAVRPVAPRRDGRRRTRSGLHPAADPRASGGPQAGAHPADAAAKLGRARSRSCFYAEKRRAKRCRRPLTPRSPPVSRSRSSRTSGRGVLAELRETGVYPARPSARSDTALAQFIKTRWTQGAAP